jgi:hypothetical protein
MIDLRLQERLSQKTLQETVEQDEIKNSYHKEKGLQSVQGENIFPER